MKPYACIQQDYKVQIEKDCKEENKIAAKCQEYRDPFIDKLLQFQSALDVHFERMKIA